MNERIKKEWIEALEGGEYKQTTQRLHDETGFCCLGVLCDLYDKEVRLGNGLESLWGKGDSEQEEPGDIIYNGEACMPPSFVAKWAGVKPDKQHNHPWWFVHPERKRSSSLDVENDGGASFPEIAELIKEYF